MTTETRKIIYEHSTTYTTEPRHRHGAINRRCLTFIEAMKNTMREQDLKTLELEQAKDLFSMTVDCWDRMTLKAYFGSRQPETPGYLQRLGLAYVVRVKEEWHVCLNGVFTESPKKIYLSQQKEEEEEEEETNKQQQQPTCERYKFYGDSQNNLTSQETLILKSSKEPPRT